MTIFREVFRQQFKNFTRSAISDKSSENVCLYSEDYDNAAWLKINGATTSANEITITNNNSLVQQNIVNAGTGFTASVWVVGVSGIGKTINIVVADAADGVPSYTNSMILTSLEQVCRISGDFSSGYSGTLAIQISGDGAASAGAVLTAKSQVEVGLVGTSYIGPTTSAPISRP